MFLHTAGAPSRVQRYADSRIKDQTFPGLSRGIESIRPGIKIRVVETRSQSRLANTARPTRGPEQLDQTDAGVPPLPDLRPGTKKVPTRAPGLRLLYAVESAAPRSNLLGKRQWAEDPGLERGLGREDVVDAT